MSLTIAFVGDNKLDYYGATPAVAADVTLDASYPAGGYVITGAQFGLRTVLGMLVLRVNTAAFVNQYFYNGQTGKLMVLGTSGGTVGTATYADSSVTNLATWQIRFLVLGQR